MGGEPAAAARGGPASGKLHRSGGDVTYGATAMSRLYELIGGREGLGRLLRHFYADVRQDPVIGPTFNEKVENWTEHLAIITSFWERRKPIPARCLPSMLRLDFARSTLSAGCFYGRQTAGPSCRLRAQPR
jgi:hypothetical protein